MLDAMLAYAETVRDSATSGIRHVVNIGIGGSDLGPQMVVPALDAYAHPGLTLPLRLERRRPRHRAGAAPAAAGRNALHHRQQDLHDAGDDGQRARREGLVHGERRHATSRSTSSPTTTNVEAAAAFGITTTFGFWDWVGGRYSLWSAIGLPIAIGDRRRSLPRAARRRACDGPALRERAAREEPAGCCSDCSTSGTATSTASRAAASRRTTRGCGACRPTCSSSRWKATASASTSTARRCRIATSPVVWGEPGTNGQHAYFQMLHQGTDVIPVEFILVRRASTARSGRPALQQQLDRQHRMLLANGLAQAQALMVGKTTDAGARREGADRIADARSGDAREPPHVPRQPAEHDPAARRADAALARRADRAVRAPRLHERRAVGHQQLRPVGRRARQGAVRATCCRCSSRMPPRRRPTSTARPRDCCVVCVASAARFARDVPESRRPRHDAGLRPRRGRLPLAARRIPAAPAAASHPRPGGHAGARGRILRRLRRRLGRIRSRPHRERAARRAHRGAHRPAGRRSAPRDRCHSRRAATDSGDRGLAAPAAWRGHRLVFLSNMPRPYAQHLEAEQPVLALFERGVFSSRLGAIKPEPALFAQAAEAFEREPSTLLLIDDNDANVKAAIDLGWSASAVRERRTSGRRARAVRPRLTHPVGDERRGSLPRVNTCDDATFSYRPPMAVPRRPD